MEEKQLKKIIKDISGIILVLVAAIIWLYYNQDTNSASVFANSNIVSGTKIEWGVKREKDHKQPDLGKTNVKLMTDYDGICMGNSEKKYVYLTFDEGYEAGYTGKILDTLKEKNVNATFFVTAHYVNTASDLIQRMINEGHIVRKPYSKSQVYAKSFRRSHKRRSNEITSSSF